MEVHQLSEYYSKYYTAFVRNAKWLIFYYNSRAEAHDIVQDAIIKAMRKPLKSEMDFCLYCYKTIQRLVLNTLPEYGKVKRWDFFDVESDNEYDEEVDNELWDKFRNGTYLLRPDVFLPDLISSCKSPTGGNKKISIHLNSCHLQLDRRGGEKMYSNISWRVRVNGVFTKSGGYESCLRAFYESL